MRKKTLIILFTGVIFLLLMLQGGGNMLANQNTPHYYALGHWPTAETTGVKGGNYVFDNDVDNHFIAEFVTVMFQETPNKWIEVGWIDTTSPYDDYRKLYVAWNVDESEEQIELYDDVDEDDYYYYEISRGDQLPSGAWEWHVYINGYEIEDSPFEAAWGDGDIMGQSESEDDQDPPMNELEGHFSNLLRPSGGGWIAWDAFNKSDPDEFYHVMKIYNYEFKTADLMEGDTTLNRCVTISDAMFIAQYLVHLRTFNEFQMECGDTTDDGNVTISDAMHIAGWVVGDPFKPLWESPADDNMRQPDDCLGSKGGTAAPEGSEGSFEATLELASAVIPPGKSVLIPVTIKGIPAGSKGLGAYDLKVAFDPKVIKIDSIQSDDIDFAKPAATYIDNANGVVRFNGFEGKVPGPVGDVTVGYLDITAIGNPGESTVLDIQVMGLYDTEGMDIVAKDVDGVITIDAGSESSEGDVD